MKSCFSLEKILGPRGPAVAAAMRAGRQFIDARDTAQLLAAVGKPVKAVKAFSPIDKSALQDSYGGNQTGPSDDFLVGRGLFYLSEQRRLFLVPRGSGAVPPPKSQRLLGECVLYVVARRR